ncbi:aspartyl-phosphate phosphatase Spo0E family protein [Thalassobacillus sp. C254]|uniref:aspartyl-phosphate phosphatase Spo0E family protein n=1 Tax=Thalassobacillus sp. C254 TaxID=1225341 RepID=UPI0006D062C1|nr:aspartyl-phosphate phosphatase Spo0E family protein [Thalassobacillus sp. C254]
MEGFYNKSLVLKIQNKRNEMYTNANQFGICDARTLVVSQELDVLLNEYQYSQQSQNISVRYHGQDIYQIMEF